MLSRVHCEFGNLLQIQHKSQQTLTKIIIEDTTLKIVPIVLLKQKGKWF